MNRTLKTTHSLKDTPENNEQDIDDYIPHETSRSKRTLWQGKGDCDRSRKKAIWETNQENKKLYAPKDITIDL